MLAPNSILYEHLFDNFIIYYQSNFELTRNNEEADSVVKLPLNEEIIDIPVTTS